MHEPFVDFFDFEARKIGFYRSQIINLGIWIQGAIGVRVDKLIHSQIPPQTDSLGIFQMLSINSFWG